MINIIKIALMINYFNFLQDVLLKSLENYKNNKKSFRKKYENLYESKDLNFFCAHSIL